MISFIRLFRPCLSKKVKISLLLVLVAAIPSVSQEMNRSTGFRIISTYDSSRTYKSNTLQTHRLHYRPIDIDVWYPAYVNSTDTTASFGDFIDLLKKRSSFYDDSKEYEGLTEEMLQYICSNDSCADYNILKSLKTRSYVNATAVKQKFPLIVYLCAFNGMSYENYQLFEDLARKGFIVASISSVGRYPGTMTMELQDLMEQVEDAKFVIRTMNRFGFEPDRVGIIGYSWGGLAATLLAMTEPHQVIAVVSLDGSEQLTYTNDEESDKLNSIRNSSIFQPHAIKSSFLYLDSDSFESDDLPDSIYNTVDFVSGEKYYIKINQSTHEEFSSLSVLFNDRNESSRYGIVKQLTTDFLLEKLKGQGIFRVDESNKLITTKFSERVGLDPSNEENILLKGVVSDVKTGQPLPYVNLGILNGDKGTTTNTLGEFKLAIDNSKTDDTLKVSMIGYEPRIFILRDIKKTKRHNLTIKLQEKTDELNEIIITDKKLATKIVGNKTDSRFFGGRFASGDLGSEIAVRIRVSNNPTYLDKFSFTISYNSEDTATFRVNIYTVKNGLPDKNIVTENILLRINGQVGKIDVDLTKYNLIVEDDIFLSLEWIEGKYNSGIVFSAGLMNSKTYYRKASQGKWRKNSMGVGFNVTARY
jgi:dienelactone hydrolase